MPTDLFLALVANEFRTRSAQLRYVMKSHAPSVGAGHETLMRRFLRDYMPQSVGVAHGFIQNHDGDFSRQMDVLIFDAFHYSPLYRIDDFVVLPAEAALAAIEVKTSVRPADFRASIAALSHAKSIATGLYCGMFIFDAPTLKSTGKCLEQCGLQSVPDQEIPDFVAGLGAYYLEKINYTDKTTRAVDHRPEGTGYAHFRYSRIGDSSGDPQDCTFEAFFSHVYAHAERSMNRGMRKGFDNKWRMKDGVMMPPGRRRYSRLSLECVDMVSRVKRFNDADFPLRSEYLEESEDD